MLGTWKHLFYQNVGSNMLKHVEHLETVMMTCTKGARLVVFFGKHFLPHPAQRSGEAALIHFREVYHMFPPGF